MKSCCCPNTPMRKIARSIHESARDVARDIAKTDAYKQSRKDGKKVEMLFAHLKRILKLDRLRLRGLSGAQDEFLLAATAQNLRRMAKRLMPAEKGKRGSRFSPKKTLDKKSLLVRLKRESGRISNRGFQQNWPLSASHIYWL
jgi:hypothetical protein